MTVKIFLTGVTGYIGGTAHADLVKAHPDYEFTLLVRNEERGKPVKAKYPQANIVYGNLEDAALIEKAAAEADVVIHTAESSDDIPSTTAIVKGLKAGHTAEKPAHYIHVSGTSILTWYDVEKERYGEGPLPEQKYYDIQGVDRLISLPDDADHRVVDKIVQTAISDAVKVAIVCPPTIYGIGHGTVNQRSIQLPDIAKGALEKGFAPIVGAGLTEWDNVHIDDLGDLFVRLVEASQDPAKRDSPDIFGTNGYFLAENGVHKWADVARWVAEAASAQGFLPEALTKSVSQTEVMNMEGGANASWGCNSKGVAERARQFLGWSPKGPPLKETIAKVVALEAEALKMTPKEKKG